MEPTEGNRRAWEAAHRREAHGGDAGLPEAVRIRLPALEGRHVLALGIAPAAAAELAGLGGLVTAVEPDAGAVGAGLQVAPTVAWIEGDVHALPVELQRSRFHLALADAALVRDPRGWARGVEAALRPEGYLLAFGEHPAAGRIDPMRRWRGDYFDGRVPTLGALVTAVARAGLVVRRLEELPALQAHRRPPPYPEAFILVAAHPGA